MQVPEFVKELVWTFYPPRYKDLSEQHFHKSLSFMSKMLLIAFLITALLYLPKVFLLKSTIEDQLSKFETFKLSGEVKQTDVLTIPRHNPWVVVDLNSNYTLKKEFLVIDANTVKYRLLNVRTLDRDSLKDFSEHKATVSGFLAALILMMLPGVALLLYVRAWLKYFLLVILFASLFFIITELTRFKLRWKQLANIAAHAITPMILIETIVSFATTAVLLPLKIRFLGLNFYAVTMLLFIVLMIVGIVGWQVQAHKEARHKK